MSFPAVQVFSFVSRSLDQVFSRNPPTFRHLPYPSFGVRHGPRTTEVTDDWESGTADRQASTMVPGPGPSPTKLDPSGTAQAKSHFVQLPKEPPKHLARRRCTSRFSWLAFKLLLILICLHCHGGLRLPSEQCFVGTQLNFTSAQSDRGPRGPQARPAVGQWGEKPQPIVAKSQQKHTLELPDWWIFPRTCQLMGLFSVPFVPFGPLASIRSPCNLEDHSTPSHAP